MTPLLTSPRLRLRPPGIGDARRLAELLNNFAVSGNLAVVPYPYTITDSNQWLGRWRADAPPAETNFIIDLSGEGAAGVLGFRLRDGQAHLGYWLGQPFWGQGIMTEAVETVIAWFFEASDAEIVTSGVFHFNMASLAIQQKLGFVETGRSELYSLARNETLEHIDTELTREAFANYMARSGANRKLA